MTTEQHLAAILAKCKANLALAEKRTQGKWIRRWDDSDQVTTPSLPPGTIVCGCYGGGNDNGITDASFIAACAGSAEAGWKATIAAIEFAQSMPGHFWREALESLIISAWPEHLL